MTTVNICFTGHRPNKLGGYDWKSEKNIAIMKKLKKVINLVIKKYNINDSFNFIFGGALGIDQMAFYIIQRLKEKYKKENTIIISTEIAIPFQKQSNKWEENDIKRYNKQIKQADQVIYVDNLNKYAIPNYIKDNYYPIKMKKRNMYMVDKSDIIIAVWNGSFSGSANCINYANKLNKTILIIDPNNLNNKIKILNN